MTRLGGFFIGAKTMLIFLCVACGHKHDGGDRVERRGIGYTMCPKCGCGGFTKRKE